MIKHHEFWNPRLFETPYYLYLILKCLFNGLRIKDLAKANYALYHGDIGIGSKYESQLAFNQSYFLPTEFLKGNLSNAKKIDIIKQFALTHGFPLILKSDVGCVGKGLCKLSNVNDINLKAPLLLGDYILQKYTPFKFEFGVFFTRENGRQTITGINQKHFPEVVGDGKRNLLELAKNHERYSHHWQSFLQSLDLSTVPEKGECVSVSFIGSHTMGCKFTDDTKLKTPELEAAIFAFFKSQPGYNFGRCDVKAESLESFMAGEFVIIEVNGVASLPTHMFDPSHSLLKAYKIFLSHGSKLVRIAKEHQQKQMELKSYKQIIQSVKASQQLLNRVHSLLKGDQ